MRIAPPHSVLLVEPNVLHRASILAVLQQMGYSVFSDADGSGAVALAQKEHPDVVLMECDLLDVYHSGFDLCSELIGHGVVRAVVMMSAAPTRETVLRALRVGALDFLVKPAPPEILTEKTDKAYRRSTPELSMRYERPVIDFGKKPIPTCERVDIVMQKATTVRALPHSVVKILQVAGASNSAADDLAKAVESDPSVAAMILKRASSSFYSRVTPIGGLRDAVVRLGFKECKDLTVSMSVINLFSKEEKTFGFSRIGYWLHSIACGLLTQEMGRVVHFADKDSAFTAGLLHDIGKIVLDDFLGTEYQIAIRMAARRGITLYQGETETLERNHVVVGKGIVDRWCFPRVFGEIIGAHHHHERFLQKEPQPPSLEGAVYLANQIVKAMMLGEAGDFIVQDIPVAMWDAYGFKPTFGKEFLDRLYAQVEEFCSFLRIDGDELGLRLGRKEDRGTVAILDPEQKNTKLMSLFLANQGFAVETCSERSELLRRDEPVQLCLWRPADKAALEAAVEEIQSQGDADLPTILVLSEGTSASGFVARKPWLRMLQAPIDCFELCSAIDALIPSPDLVGAS